LEAEKSFHDSDLNGDGIIDPDELLKAMYEIYIFLLEIALAERNAESEVL
jgi:hypothetical protein